MSKIYVIETVFDDGCSSEAGKADSARHEYYLDEELWKARQAQIEKALEDNDLEIEFGQIHKLDCTYSAYEMTVINKLPKELPDLIKDGLSCLQN